MRLDEYEPRAWAAQDRHRYDVSILNACRESAQTTVAVGVDQLGRPAFGAAINDAMNEAVAMGEEGIPSLVAALAELSIKLVAAGAYERGERFGIKVQADEYLRLVLDIMASP